MSSSVVAEKEEVHFEDGKKIKKDEEEEEGDENVERGNWGSQLDFILSCVGYAVGLGNVWRFPYLCYRNGGGAFLIPYIIMLAFAGVPMFFLELCLGQYSSRGPITCWDAVPAMKGVGYGFVTVSAFVGIYYNVVITYTIYYMFASLNSELPWATCHHEWNTEYCSQLVNECLDKWGMALSDNNTCVEIGQLSEEELARYNWSADGNITGYHNDPFHDERMLASEEYWLYGVLQISDNINETGTIVWQLALCLIAAWLIIFFCLIKGVKSSGKVVYFTATFPYVVLLILLIRGVLLPGYMDGIIFFITPKWNRLADPAVWRDAAGQIFFSLSASWGGLITLASYNRFHNNCYRDSLLVPLINCGTSIFAGFVIFSVIGFMAHELDTNVEDVVKGGFGLAFIAYPEALQRMPAAPFWSFLFFFMLLTLGLDSQFTIMETISTAVSDNFPKIANRKNKWKVIGSLCIVGYFLSLLCVSQAGYYWVDMLNEYGGTVPLLMYGLFECITFGWLYGIKRFMNDIATMLGEKVIDFPLFYWWPLNWCALTPAILTFILLFNFIRWEEPGIAAKEYEWAQFLSYSIIILCVIWIPVVWIYEFVKAKGGPLERLKAMIKSKVDWGPVLPKFRLEAYEMHRRRGTSLGGKLHPDKENGKAGPDYSQEKSENPDKVEMSRV